MKVAMICDVMGQPNNGTTLAALNLIRYLRDELRLTSVKDGSS